MSKDSSILFLLGAGALFLLSKGSKASPPGTIAPINYIKSFYPYALQTEKYYNVPALVTISQGGLESGWGNSNLALNARNHFGIKADASWKGRRYNNFRAYDNVIESFADHAKFLRSNNRYKNAFATKDPVQFIKVVAEAGYDEGPGYFEKMKQTINAVKKIVA